jgi:uncharacterized repeat protein (TIGR01451 family)
MDVARRWGRAGLGGLAVALAGALPARAEEGGCQRWDLEVVCATSAPQVTLGDEFSATATVRNTGDTALVNVTLTLRGDQGAPCISGEGPALKITLERLEPGDSKQVTGRFLPENIGVARVLGSARDSLGWAAANCACTVNVVGLVAIQSDMRDRDVGGTEKGVFRVGESIVYSLEVQNDGGSGATPSLKVVVTLPKELRFVSGKGPTGMTFTASGTTVESTPFVLVPPDQKAHIELTVRVASKPPVSFVKTRASIQTLSGVELAGETESTTIQGAE